MIWGSKDVSRQFHDGRKSVKTPDINEWTNFIIHLNTLNTGIKLSSIPKGPRGYFQVYLSIHYFDFSTVYDSSTTHLITESRTYCTIIVIMLHVSNLT